MAGYMGFGMQSWLYKKSTRKPFEKRKRIPSFSALPKYSRTFTIKPKIKENKKFHGLLTISIIFSFAFVISFMPKKFVNYSKNISEQKSLMIDLKDKEAFDFLLKSGMSRLKSNNILGAYSEFSLAYNINTNDENLKQVLIETLSILCNDNVTYCNELDELLKGEY